ncbi:MAG: sulfatase [Odoribacter sp.]
MSAVSGWAQNQERKSPNIIYIMTDDHSYQTISAYGSQCNETPHIDRIGLEGTVFRNSFVTNSISGPCRAVLLTGKFSHLNGFKTNSDKFDGSQQTFPKLLQQAGYETAIVGKWHLASDPTGFDYWNILLGQGIYYNPPFNEMGKVKKMEGYATNVTTDIAIDWMKNRKKKEKPFCLLLHHKAPHRTWMPDTCDLGAYDGQQFDLPENFYDDYAGRKAAAEQRMSVAKDMNEVYDLKMADKEGVIKTGSYLDKSGREMLEGMNPQQRKVWDAYYDPIINDFKEKKLSGKELAEWKYQRYMKDYLSCIKSVDENVGRVLAYLEENGMLENTVVIYSSDQGFYMGEHGWFDKRFMYEESFRTPLLVRLPHSMKQKNEVKELVQNIDLAPTILELAGVQVPADMQGCSWLPLLDGTAKKWRKSLYYHFYESQDEHAVHKHYGVRTDRYKLIHFYDGIDDWQLFDLKKDPKEMNNLIQNAKYTKVLAALKKELDRLKSDYKEENR